MNPLYHRDSRPRPEKDGVLDRPSTVMQLLQPSSRLLIISVGMQHPTRGAAVLAVLALSTSAQNFDGWRDLSPHGIQFVTVDEGVRVGVLDWGGSGRPVVLLSGLEGTAHTFDDFAPKLGQGSAQKKAAVKNAA